MPFPTSTNSRYVEYEADAELYVITRRDADVISRDGKSLIRREVDVAYDATVCALLNDAVLSVDSRYRTSTPYVLLPAQDARRHADHETPTVDVPASATAGP